MTSFTAPEGVVGYISGVVGTVVSPANNIVSSKYNKNAKK
jgi:hypothetical protein